MLGDVPRLHNDLESPCAQPSTGIAGGRSRRVLRIRSWIRFRLRRHDRERSADRRAAAHQRRGRMAVPGRDFANSRYSPLAQITPEQREESPRLVDVLDRRAARTRGSAARRRQHDVPRHAVSERGVRDRSHAAGLSAQVEVPAGERAGGGRHRVLRRRESRRVVRQRQDRLQPARRTHRRRGRRDRHRAVEDEDGRRATAARRSRWRRSS